MPKSQLTPDLINAAIEGYQAQKARMDERIAELRAMLKGGSPAENDGSNASGRRRKLSAAGRKRIAEAQRKRWANSGKQAGSTSQEPAKPKRRLSAAGRARIIAATKKRWAEARAAKQAQAAKKA